jgi:hypothetical protein
MKRDASALITMGAPNISPVSRPSVRWKGDAPPRIGTCCLAKSLRDTGQSREPDPPQRTAGITRPWRRLGSALTEDEWEVMTECSLAAG